MRNIINSLTKKHSTKAERRFLELLKESHTPFQSKVKICGREVDFLINNYAIDIDGHKQDVYKNHMLIESGYIPIHYNNNEIGPHLITWIKKLWQEDGKDLIRLKGTRVQKVEKKDELDSWEKKILPKDWKLEKK